MWLSAEINRQTWNMFWPQIEHANLLQSWEYGEVKHRAQGWKPRRFIIQNESDQARSLVQVLTKTFPFVGGIARINRGPQLLGTHTNPKALHSEMSQALAAILQLARRERWRYLRIAPEIPKSSEAKEMMAKLGFWPGRGLAWGSAVLSLEPSEEDIFKNLKGKWRNLLRKAQRFELNVKVSSNPGDIDVLIKEYKGLQKRAGFKGIPEGIIKHLSTQSGPNFDFTLFWAKEQNSSSPIGLLVRVGHGDTCTYFIGWTSSEGRRLQANYLLLWNSIIMSKNEGYRWFDLGGMHDNTPKGIAHFKSGIGGVPYSLIGEWKWHIAKRKKSEQA